MLGIGFFMYELQSSYNKGSEGLDGLDLGNVAPAWAFLIVCWGIALESWWGSTERMLQIHWNMADFESSDQARADQRTTRAFYKKELWTVFRRVCTYSICVILLVLDISLIVGLLIGRWYLVRHTDYGWAASAIQGIVIVIVSASLLEVAILLTEQENHVTNTTFEYHLIAKSFTLQAVNSYLIFIITAFVKANGFWFNTEKLLGYCTCPKSDWVRDGVYDEDCAWTEKDCKCPRTGNGHGPDCMIEMGTTLLSIFVTNLLIGNIIEIVVPYLCGLFRKQYDYYSAPEGSNLVAGGDEEHETSIPTRQQMEVFGLRLVPNDVYIQRHNHIYMNHREGYFGTFDDISEVCAAAVEG